MCAHDEYPTNDFRNVVLSIKTRLRDLIKKWNLSLLAFHSAFISSGWWTNADVSGIYRPQVRLQKITRSIARAHPKIAHIRPMMKIMACTIASVYSKAWEVFGSLQHTSPHPLTLYVINQFKHKFIQKELSDSLMSLRSQSS